MTTTIFFVRHAESFFVEGKEQSRGLSEQGKADSLIVSELLIGEEIDLFVSSPYERAIETIRPAASECARTIQIEGDLRERAIGDFSPESFMEAKRRVYTDFHYAYPNGESSFEAQRRAINIVDNLLEAHPGKRIVMGTHGDIMTQMLNGYDEQYGFEFWQSTSMPDIYRASFEKKKLTEVTRLWKSGT